MYQQIKDQVTAEAPSKQVADRLWAEFLAHAAEAVEQDPNTPSMCTECFLTHNGEC